MDYPVKDCSFHDADGMIKYRIVLGTNSKEVREKLLHKDSLSFENAIKIAQAYETSRAQMKEINEENGKEIHSVRDGPGRKSSTRPRVQGKDLCSRCGKDHS